MNLTCSIAKFHYDTKKTLKSIYEPYITVDPMVSTDSNVHSGLAGDICVEILLGSCDQDSSWISERMIEKGVDRLCWMTKTGLIFLDFPVNEQALKTIEIYTKCFVN
jgi:hypothetical protein